MRELVRSTLGLSWALPLLGAQQAARWASSADPATRGADLDRLALVARRQLSDPARRLLDTGRRAEAGLRDLAAAALQPERRTPDALLRLAGDAVRRSGEGMRVALSGSTPAAGRELLNKAEVFVLVKQVALLLDLPDEFPLPIGELVDRAYALGPFAALWAVEGLGHDYTESFWRQGIVPRGLLARDRGLPPRSLLMLHAGMGLFFADELLPRNAAAPAAELRSTVARIVDLCRRNSLAGYLGPALESLGLVSRLFRSAAMAAAVDRALRRVAPEALGFFWHGAGRGLYFLPINFLPCSSWQAFEMAAREAPDERAHRNAVAGLAWAQLLVNERQPEVLWELVVEPHGERLADRAFVNGIASALIMRQDTTPEAAFQRTFLGFRPAAGSAAARRRWDELVRRPGGRAVAVSYPLLRAADRLGEIFRFGRLPGLQAEEVG